jgi:uncharacterized protein YlxW (UPF0749 family)
MASVPSTSASSTSSTVGAQATNRGLFYVMAPLAVMTFVLGGFIALALKTENRVRQQDLPSSRYSGLAEAYMSMKNGILEQQATIKGLQITNEKLDQSVTARAPQLTVVADQVNEARFIAGLTEVKGPGIVVTLSDSNHAPASSQSSLVPMMPSDYVIHDIDIERILDELKAAGAEAFSVSGERIIANTPILCVGPAIQINGVPLTSPYEILCIGDTSKLAKALDINGGIVDEFDRTDPAMISIRKSQSLVIPAYAGATQYHYAKPVIANASKSKSGGK